jgi:hypothetical protein
MQKHSAKLRNVITGLVLSVLLISQAQAEWSLIDENNIFKIFVEKGSLNKQNEYFYIWALYDFNQRQTEGYHSAKVLYQIDCTALKYKLLSANTFGDPMGQGVSGSPKASDRWEQSTRGSIGYEVTRYACDSVSQ